MLSAADSIQLLHHCRRGGQRLRRAKWPPLFVGATRLMGTQDDRSIGLARQAANQIRREFWLLFLDKFNSRGRGRKRWAIKRAGPKELGFAGTFGRELLTGKLLACSWFDKDETRQTFSAPGLSRTRAYQARIRLARPSKRVGDLKVSQRERLITASE